MRIIPSLVIAISFFAHVTVLAAPIPQPIPVSEQCQAMVDKFKALFGCANKNKQSELSALTDAVPFVAEPLPIDPHQSSGPNLNKGLPLLPPEKRVNWIDRKPKPRGARTSASDTTTLVDHPGRGMNPANSKDSKHSTNSNPLVSHTPTDHPDTHIDHPDPSVNKGNESRKP